MPSQCRDNDFHSAAVKTPTAASSGPMGEKGSSPGWCPFRETETMHYCTNTAGLYRVQQATAPWDREYKGQRKGPAQNSEQGLASYPTCANSPSYLLPQYGPSPPQDQESRELLARGADALAGSSVLHQHLRGTQLTGHTDRAQLAGPAPHMGSGIKEINTKIALAASSCGFTTRLLLIHAFMHLRISS